MFDDYAVYQGVALREVIVTSQSPVTIRPYCRSGRLTAYVLDESVGIFIKHSAQRLPPWQFTFHAEQLEDVHTLYRAFPASFVTFVCGLDGVVTLDIATF